MNVYIATSIGNVDAYRTVRQVLSEMNIGITFDWTCARELDHTFPGPEHTERALVDLNGVRGADFVVVLLSGGNGTHVELGYALALGKPVLMLGVYDAKYISVFHHHPLVTRALTITREIDVEDIEHVLNNFIRKWFGIR